MGSPFEILRNSGLNTVGVDVLDAPDQRLREVAIRAQQGQALSPRDVSRLAQRQGVELETARRAGVPGAGAAVVPGSVLDLLSGTRLDPAMQQALATQQVAAAAQANEAAKIAPVLSQVQLQEANRQLALGSILKERAEAEARAAIATANITGSPLGQAALTQSLLGQADPMARKAIEMGVYDANDTSEQRAAKVRDYATASAIAQQEGRPVDEVFRDLRTKVAVQPARPLTTGSSQVKIDDLVGLSVAERQQKLAPAPTVENIQDATNRVAAAQYGAGNPISMLQLKEVRKAVTPKVVTKTFSDPVTGDVLEADVLEDAYGNIHGTQGAVRMKTPAKDEGFEDVQKWRTTDRVTAASNLASVARALGVLKSGEQVSGPFIGTINDIGLGGIGPFTAQMLTGGRLAQVERDVQNAVLPMIKQIYGSNPAQNEAKMLLDRAFNPKQSEAENARRVAILLNTLNSSAKVKEALSQFQERTGSTKYFKGPTFEQLVSEANKAFGPDTPAGTPAPRVAPESAKAFLEGK